LKGKVKWFNSQRGFGFISGDDGKDVFVHYTSIQGKGYKNLMEGQIVEYGVMTQEDGRTRAINVIVKGEN